MDFGHSFSRTLETDERFKLRHGEAVAIDCVMNSMIANVQGHLSTPMRSVLDRVPQLAPCSIEGITAETYKEGRARDHGPSRWDPEAPITGRHRPVRLHGRHVRRGHRKAFAKLEAFIDEHPETKWNLGWSFAAAGWSLRRDARQLTPAQLASLMFADLSLSGRC